MNNTVAKRNPLTPWFVGAIIILARSMSVFIYGRAGARQSPIELGVLAVIPVVYLMLMYLTFVSQEWSRAHRLFQVVAR